MAEPAALAIIPPFPFVVSILCTKVDAGMFLSGIAFPTFIDTFSPATTVSPTFNFTGARMYLLSPSIYLIKAILDVLFGSYSIDSTTPGTSYLSLLKSTILNLLFTLPPL